MGLCYLHVVNAFDICGILSVLQYFDFISILHYMKETVIIIVIALNSHYFDIYNKLLVMAYTLDSPNYDIYSKYIFVYRSIHKKLIIFV